MPIPAPPGQHGQRAPSSFTVVPAQPAAARSATLSIALPSSILSNAQSPELRMYLAGQVARAAAIYCVDEIVIFREEDPAARERADARQSQGPQPPDPAQFFQLVLEYLETPQYLRKHLFPVSRDLRLVGLLNPLALPSHVARNDFARWREGIAVGRVGFPRGHPRNPARQSYDAPEHSRGPPTRYVDVGQERLAEIDVMVPVGQRVTVDMEPSGPDYASCPGKYLFGRLTDRDAPKAERTYWGYSVRIADSLSAAFQNSVVAPNGYDVTVGTSERGTPITSFPDASASFELPEYSNLLIVFGGVHGLERSVQGDHSLESIGISSARDAPETASADEPLYTVGDLFDFYVNTCPNQGSRTIRTEEAILISLAALQPFLRPR